MFCVLLCICHKLLFDRWSAWDVIESINVDISLASFVKVLLVDQRATVEAACLQNAVVMVVQYR